jgi:hypothetical protein
MNVFYNPDKFGLSIVGEVEFSSGIYEFDTSVVWCDESGQHYVADDSGCSCPEPFENVDISNLRKIDRLQDLVDYFDQRKAESYRYEPDEDYASRTVSEIDGAIGTLVLKVKDALDAQARRPQ